MVLLYELWRYNVQFSNYPKIKYTGKLGWLALQTPNPSNFLTFAYFLQCPCVSASSSLFKSYHKMNVLNIRDYV